MTKILLLLTALSSLLFSAIDECKTDVYFGNGILTKEKDAKFNAEIVLKPAIIKKFGIDYYNHHIGKVDYAYNTTHGTGSDLFESFLQKVDESHVVAALWNGFKVVVGQRLRGVDEVIALFEENR